MGATADRMRACGIALVAGSLVAVPSASTAASSARAGDGRASVSQSVRVAKVADGDTVYIRRRPVPVRLIGIDAPDKGTGDCMVAQSTRGLKRLLRPDRAVRLHAARRDSTSYGNGMRRPLRYVESRGTDLSEAMLRAGLAVFNPSGTEHALERRHARAAQEAAAQRLGLWRTDACGAGPPASLRVFVNYNADGSDSQNFAGKYIRIVNDGDPISLAGWTLRLGNRKYFRLPDLMLAPRQSVVVHNGSGTGYFDGDHHLFWGERIQLADPRTSANKAGAVYLQDPRRNYRAWSIWPCALACPSAGARGRLRLDVVARPSDGPTRERFLISNVSAEPVDASFLVLESGMSVFELPQGSVVDPGRTITVWVGGGDGGYAMLRRQPLLPDTGGSAILRGNDTWQIDSARW